MDQLWWIFLAACLCLAICGFAGGYVATQKRREVIEGILFGLFLGPFGVIAAACLPDSPESTAPQQEPGDLLSDEEHERVRAALADISRGLGIGPPKKRRE